MSTPSDRELLERAAKAAGIDWAPSAIDWKGLLLPSHAVWNPLTDDGDALRLAVKLSLRVGIAFYYSDKTDQAEVQDYDETLVRIEPAEGSDPFAATRRAIVRAAAATAATSLESSQ